MKNQITSFVAIWILLGFVNLLSGQDTPLEILQNQAKQLIPQVESPLATQFLKAAEQLPGISEPRFVYYNQVTRDAFSEEEAYNPQSDGRSPFPRELYEKMGFGIIAFDIDDTDFAHQMARVFGWDQQMNLETDLAGMYTLLKKR